MDIVQAIDGSRAFSPVIDNASVKPRSERGVNEWGQKQDGSQRRGAKKLELIMITNAKACFLGLPLVALYSIF